MNDQERRRDTRVEMTNLSWSVRSEVSNLGTPMVVENLSCGGACLRLDHRSTRAERMLEEALSAPYLIEVATGSPGRPRLALLRWGVVGEGERGRRFGLEWIEPLERYAPAWAGSTPGRPRASRPA